MAVLDIDGTTRNMFGVSVGGNRVDIRSNAGIIEVRNSGGVFRGVQTRTLLSVSAPTVNDDSSLGYLVTDEIYNTTTNRAYICLDNTVGAAVWYWYNQGGGSIPWGGITGTLSNQTDLQDALDAKQPLVDVSGGRLTPTSNTPEENYAFNQTTLYFSPFKSNRLALYNGTKWVLYTFTEKTLKTTDTQTGSTQLGIKIITGLTDTSQFIVGMVVSGTNIAASSVISTIDSPTQVTLNNNCTGTGSVAITFKFPKDSNYDVYVHDVAGTPKLKAIKWSNDTTRATALVFQDRRRVKTSDATWLYLGCFRTSTVDGQFTTAPSMRYLWNEYNRMLLDLHYEIGGGHPYTLNVPREWGGAEARLKFVYGGYEPLILPVTINGGVVAGMLGVNYDSVAFVTQPYVVGSDNISTWAHQHGATYIKKYPAGTIGYHYIAILEQGNTTANGYFSSPWISMVYNW